MSERDLSNLPDKITSILIKKERTWLDLGVCWQWATQQEWWLDFLWTVGASFATIPLRCVPPDGFANELHAYLKERK